MGSLKNEEFTNRLQAVQELCRKNGLDAVLVFGSEAEPANLRYLSDYWPSFECGAVFVPAEGEPALLIGPESLTFATARSRIGNICRLLSFRESSQPRYPGTALHSFEDVLAEFSTVPIKRLGVAGFSIMPFPVALELETAMKWREIVNVDKLLQDMRSVKSPAEIEVMRRAYRITETGLKAVLDNIRPGLNEIEVVAEAEYAMLKAGAEATAFPVWCCSGSNSNQAISRPTERKIGPGEIIQVCIGARVDGYCSSIGRGIILGRAEKRYEDVISVAVEAENLVIDSLRAGISAREVTRKRDIFLKGRGYGDFILYGPCHGTGLMECEAPWMESNSTWDLREGMFFSVDTFLQGDGYGVRLEDGVLIKQNGVEQFSNLSRTLIRI
ncbi:MAG: Xaa-Pro peptidase family protein [bacterium]|nr:Xaa-Pro peptidase family protein [bacterium]